MTTTLYLDLEGTVIKGWDDQVLMNVRRLRDLLSNNPDIDRRDVRVFSFAIYNDKDKDEFVRFIKPMVENALDVTITQWPSLYDMAVASQKLSGHRWVDQDDGSMDVHDYISIVGKVNAFEDWVTYYHGDGSRVMLVDDIVPNKTVLNHSLGLQVDFVNVVNVGVV